MSNKSHLSLFSTSKLFLNLVLTQWSSVLNSFGAFDRQFHVCLFCPPHNCLLTQLIFVPFVHAYLEDFCVFSCPRVAPSGQKLPAAITKESGSDVTKVEFVPKEVGESRNNSSLDRINLISSYHFR